MKVVLITVEGRVTLDIVEGDAKNPPTWLHTIDNRKFSGSMEYRASAEITKKTFRLRGEDHGVFVYAEM